MKISADEGRRTRSRDVPPEGTEKNEEGRKKLDKVRAAVERDRIEILDRHHETVKKSAQLYDTQIRKELLEKDKEKRRVLQREFHAERAAMDEIRRRARIKAEG